MDRNEHFYEAAYQTWMRGGNPDRLSFDRAEQDWYNGKEPDYTAQMEINRQRKPQDEAEEGGSVLFRQPHVSGSLPLFKCKCGYETSNSVAWCVHADCCNGNDS